MTLELPEAVRTVISEHAHDGSPEEVVGVLAGHHGDPSIVEQAYPATNASETPETRYEIAPSEVIELLDRIDDTGYGLVGFYHSHPHGPAQPSETDERQAAWVGYSYVIVSLAGRDVDFGSWRWRGDSFERESIRII